MTCCTALLIATKNLFQCFPIIGWLLYINIKLMRHQAFCLCTYRQLTTENIFCLAVSYYLTTFATMDFVYQKFLNLYSLGLLKESFHLHQICMLMQVGNINCSCPNPGQREKINLSFHFHTSLWNLRCFMSSLSSLDMEWPSEKFSLY